MLIRVTISVLIVLVTAFQLSAQTYRGNIIGKVFDARTQEPLPGVNILVVEKPTDGTSTDLDGNFNINGLGVGTYSLRVSAVGYRTEVVTNVVISTGRASLVHVNLNENAIEMGEVKIQANYFDPGRQIAPVSSNSADRAEIRRTPGSIQDVQRVMQNFPGVASSTDNINELIVRGGAPFENLTVMDHMEIPSINHYSNQNNSAGPINMVNADMIEDAQFSAGGFPVEYGDKSSSVMTLTMREGNRNAGFSSNTGFNMAGAGTLIEGGFAGGRGSYISSARISLLEIVDKLIGISAISLTAIPKYWDTQTKIAYDLNQTNKLSFDLLYGESRIDIKGNVKEQDPLRTNMIDSSSVEHVYPINKQYVAGINLRTLLSKKGFSVLTLYSTGTTYKVDVSSDFAWRIRGQQGEVLDYSIISSRRVFHNYSNESFVAAKYALFYEIHPQHELSAGAQIQTALNWKNNIWIESDTVRYDLNRDGIFETGQLVIPEGNVDQKFRFGQASKYYVYLSDKFSITPELALTVGVRYDHFTYSGKGIFSPRASLSYQIIPPTTTITLAGGVYAQSQPLPYYGDRRNNGYNHYIDDMKAEHLVLGLQHFFNDGLKLSIETYYKRYSRVAVPENFIFSAIDTFWSDRILTVGKRHAYGLELFLEQKQVKDFFCTVSISLSRTEDADPKIPKHAGSSGQAGWYPSEYDYPVIVTVLGRKVVKGIRDWLDRTPFFIKYPSYILPFSNEMEISFKYRYQTGRPYTPEEFITWKQYREGGIKWSNGAWIETDRVNSARYPNYSRLDLQWISRFYFKTFNITSIWHCRICSTQRMCSM